jgi:ABC-2 type transport system ATP-binding protein
MLDEADRICDRVGILKTKLVAVGTPEELRESLFARITIFQLDTVSDAVVSAVRRLGIEKIEVGDGGRLLVSVKNPDEENPEIVHAIDGAGGRIRSVYQSNPTLEDVYLKLVKD